jgi:thiamine transport system permease protein
VAQQVAGDFFLISIYILLINFSALFVLLLKLHSFETLDFPMLAPALIKAGFFTFNQGALSAMGSVAIGLLAAPGYSRLGKLQRPLRWILILPNLMSPALTILALLVSIDKFPFGLPGIVLGHVFLNGGLCTVWLGEAWQKIDERWAPVNFVIGGSQFKYFRKVILPQMLPVIINTTAVIFSFCISSFAIPLVFGGGPQNSTLEVLIYERLRIAGDLNAAVLIAIVQSLIQFGVFLFILNNLQMKISSPSRILMKKSLFSLPATFLLIPLLLTIIPLFNLFQTAAAHLTDLGNILALPDFKSALENSVIVALAVGIVMFFFLSIVASRGVRPFTLKLPPLSGVVIGLAGLALLNDLNVDSRLEFLLFLVYGHFCVIFLPLLRLTYPHISALRDRFEKVVVQIGAPRRLAFKRVYFPLEVKFFASASVLAAIWSMGEFSVSRLLSGEQSTLPIFIANLLSSYRLELASSASILLLAVTIVSVTLFEVLIYGLG